MTVSNQKIMEIVQLARRVDHFNSSFDEARFDRELAQLPSDEKQMVFGAMKLLNERRPFSWTHHEPTALQRFKVLADEVGATYRASQGETRMEAMLGPRPDLTTVIFFPPLDDAMSGMKTYGRIVEAVQLRDVVYDMVKEDSDEPDWHRIDGDILGYYFEVSWGNFVINYESPNTNLPKAAPEPKTVKFAEGNQFPYRIDFGDVFNVEWDADGNFIIVAYEPGPWEHELRNWSL